MSVPHDSEECASAQVFGREEEGRAIAASDATMNGGIMTMVMVMVMVMVGG
jgi:hypothetical protein